MATYLKKHNISAIVDNLNQRRIIAMAGVIIAFLGLTSFLWGMLKNDQAYQMIGFFSIIIAYVLMVAVKKLRERAQAEKDISKIK
jgi:uncharacterized membrane protein YfcA